MQLWLNYVTLFHFLYRLMYTLQNQEIVQLSLQTMILNRLLKYCLTTFIITYLLGRSAFFLTVEMQSSIPQRLVYMIVLKLGIVDLKLCLWFFFFFFWKLWISLVWFLGWSSNITDGNVANKHEEFPVAELYGRSFFSRWQLHIHHSWTLGADKCHAWHKRLSLVHDQVNKKYPICYLSTM